MLQLQSAPILDNSILTPSNIWDPTETVQLVPADLSLEDILTDLGRAGSEVPFECVPT